MSENDFRDLPLAEIGESKIGKWGANETEDGSISLHKKRQSCKITIRGRL